MTDPTIAVSPVMITLAGVVVSIAVAWGVMKSTLRHMSTEIQSVRHDLRNFQTAQQAFLVETLERVARIEGELKVRNH